jgi:hypothetical protein
VENLRDAIESVPEAAPVLILGALIGVVWGLVVDWRKDEFGTWWQYGGAGAFVAALVLIAWPELV